MCSSARFWSFVMTERRYLLQESPVLAQTKRMGNIRGNYGGNDEMPLLLVIGVMLALMSAPSAAPYPNKPITVIVPFAAGGPTDVVTRLIGEHMSRMLGQTLVVENIGGAGGTLGMTRAAQAQPDGYTIAVGNMGTQSAAPALYPNLKYDPAKSFAQVGIVNYTPQAIVAKKATPAGNLKELIRYLEAN